MDICCSETDQSTESCGKLLFPISPVIPSRDTMTRNPRTNSCDLLSQLPSSMPLESRIYQQSLLSNQPRWSNYANSTESSELHETFGTKVPVPVPFELLELFAATKVYEDQKVRDFITAQCSISMKQQPIVNSCGMAASFEASTVNRMDRIQAKPFLKVEVNQRESTNHFQLTQNSSATALESVSLPDDISLDRLHFCNSSVNFSMQLHSDNAGLNRTCMPSAENGSVATLHKSVMSNTSNMQMEFHSFGNKDQTMDDKDLMRKKKDQSASISDCSDQTDAKDRKIGKGPSINFVAERRRRDKLNERLYALRALVPEISTIDRASLPDGAIEYVKELQKQVKELLRELEDHRNNETGNSKITKNDNYRSVDADVLLLNKNGVFLGPKSEPTPGRTQDSEYSIDKAQKMEWQLHVEVTQPDGNEFLVKVFREQKASWFVRLMEALSSLALEVTHVNVISFRKLVSNVFKVEKKDGEIVQADHVRDSLLALARNQGTGLRSSK